MNETVSMPKEEYDELVRKAALFEHYVETEELTPSELNELNKALKGPFFTKAEFMKRHPELK